MFSTEIFLIILSFISSEDIYKKLRPLNNFFYDLSKYKEELDLSWVFKKKHNLNILYHFDKNYVKILKVNDISINNIHLNKLMKYYTKVKEVNLLEICPCYWDFHFMEKPYNINIRKINLTNLKWIYMFDIFNVFLGQNFRF